MVDTYTCEHCHNTYESGWSDEEAADEAKDLWGIESTKAPDIAVICDDCFNAMMSPVVPASATVH